MYSSVLKKPSVSRNPNIRIHMVRGRGCERETYCSVEVAGNKVIGLFSVSALKSLSYRRDLNHRRQWSPKSYV